jgi:hypothetical protein
VSDFGPTGHELNALGNHKHGVVIFVILGFVAERKHRVRLWIPEFLSAAVIEMSKAVVRLGDPSKQVIRKGRLLQRIIAKDKTLLLRCPCVLAAYFLHGVPTPRVELGRTFGNQGAPCGRRGLLSI